MAFENVFGGVRFDLPVRAAEREQANFLNMVGAGIEDARRKQEFDLRKRQIDMQERQMENEMSKPAPFDIKNAGQMYMIESLMGRNPGMTPQEAAARVYSASKQAVNPYTGQSTPNIMSTLGLESMTGATTQALGGFDDSLPNPPPSMGGSALPDAGTGSAGLDTTLMTPEQSRQRAETIARQADVSNIAPAFKDPLDARPQYSGETPGAKKSSTEAAIARDKAVSEYAAKKGVDLQFMDAKQKKQLMFEMEKERRQMEQAAKRAEPQKMSDADTLTTDINRALGVLSEDTMLPATGTAGRLLSGISETAAGQLEGHLKSVKNLVGFGRLERMREGSPTGSSGLGALSEQEMRGLQSTSGNLEVGQTKEVLDYNLRRLYNEQMNLVHGTPEHIAKVGQEKGLPPAEINRLSFRYNLEEQPLVFNSEADLQGVKLPPNTPIIINGRRARVK